MWAKTGVHKKRNSLGVKTTVIVRSNYSLSIAYERNEQTRSRTRKNHSTDFRQLLFGSYTCDDDDDVYTLVYSRAYDRQRVRFIDGKPGTGAFVLHAICVFSHSECDPNTRPRQTPRARAKATRLTRGGNTYPGRLHRVQTGPDGCRTGRWGPWTRRTASPWRSARLRESAPRTRTAPRDGWAPDRWPGATIVPWRTVKLCARRTYVVYCRTKRVFVFRADASMRSVRAGDSTREMPSAFRVDAGIRSGGGCEEDDGVWTLTSR